MDKSNILDSVTPEIFERDATNWLRIIRYHESGLIISFQQDVFYRVSQIIRNKKILKNVLGRYYLKYIIGYVSLEKEDITNQIKETILQIAKQRKISIPKERKNNLESIIHHLEKLGYDIGLFVFYINDALENKKETHHLKELEYLTRNYKNFSLICFSYKNIAYSRFKDYISNYSFLFTNVMIYPLYNTRDSIFFINLNCKNWQIKLDKKTKEKIRYYTGGYHWLSRHILRFLRNHPKKTLNQALKDEFLYRKVYSLWQRLTKKEQDILENIYLKVLTDKDISSEEFNYLLKTRLIIQENNNFYLGIKLFSMIIDKKKRISLFHVKNGKIFFREKIINSHFSSKELALLSLFINEQGNIVHRDKIAKTLWKAKWEEKYSDWAIDRLVYRLRKKIVSLGLDRNLVRTIKKRGFIFA